MKIIILALSSIILIIGCRKNPISNNPPTPAINVIPEKVPVTTSLMIYPIDNNQSKNPINIDINRDYFNYNSTYSAYTFHQTTLDQYQSTIRYNAAYLDKIGLIQGFELKKTFCTLPSAKTYQDIKLPVVNYCGYINSNSTGGTVTLPNNGQFVAGSLSFGQYTPNLTYEIPAGYSNPSIKDYAVTLPCYPMGDENGERKFLNSYGIYLIQVTATSFGYGNTDEIDHNVGVNITLQIPDYLLSQAPDSIATWNLDDNNAWKKNGYAYKSGNFYKKKIDRKGYWNFAVPVDGIYTTIKLNSETKLPVTNTRFLVKDGINEVAEGRTNSNGEALLFVPANKSLNVEVINDHTPNPAFLKDSTLGPINTITEKTLVIADMPELVTIEGNVYNCDLSPLTSGSIILTSFIDKDAYQIPISNNQFKTANWIYDGGHNPTHIKISNSQGDSLYNYTILIHAIGLPTNHYYSNYYTCPNASQLYSFYDQDSVNHFKFLGDVSSSSPTLTCIKGGQYDYTININDKGNGITIGFNWVSYAILPQAGLTINGKSYRYASLIPSDLVIYRLDTAVGGFVEGFFSINYLDDSSNKHNLTGSFRVKRI